MPRRSESITVTDLHDLAHTASAIAAHLAPTFPPSVSSWYHIIAIAVTGAVKVRRGNRMRTQARRIDLFGWSIILFDLVFGGALVLAVVWAFYPILDQRWFDLAVTTAILAVALLQAYTMEIATPHRISLAMSKAPALREDGTPIGEERRQQVRRQADRDRDAEAEANREELRRYRARYPEV